MGFLGKIMVTGGAGFLGSHVLEELASRGFTDVVAPRSRECDLRDRRQIVAFLRHHRPSAVIHLAALVGGIGANMANPGLYLYENAVMGLELIEACRLEGVGKVVVTGTICAYPKHAPVPFREEHLWDGYPEETNAPYGLAKKLVMVQGEAYHRQYGLEVVNLLLVNLYGPRDNFSPQTSHVIPALIKKCLEAQEAGRDHIEVWGDGSATREFLYVTDAARAIVLALERHRDPSPLNVGTGCETPIRELVERIGRATGFTGSVRWDSTRPNGQPRRCLDVRRIHDQLGWRASMELDEGLERTVAWYRSRPA